MIKHIYSVSSLIPQINNSKYLVIDTETTGLHWWSDSLLGVGLLWGDSPEQTERCYVPIVDNIDHRYMTDFLLQLDKPVWVGHNIKFDLHFLFSNIPIETSQSFLEKIRIVDTSELIHLYDSRLPKNLENAEMAFLGTTTKHKHLQGMKRKKMTDVPTDRVAEYCLNDCDVTFRLMFRLLPEIKELNLMSLFYKDMEYLKVLYWIEKIGFKIHPEALHHSKVFLKEHQKNLEKELYEKIGAEFNWRSHKVLSHYLYDVMGIDRPVNPFLDEHGNDMGRNPQKRMYNSTMVSSFILVEKAKHPLAELVASLRECDKLKATIDRWLSLMDKNNVLHTSFNLTGTRTGRLSSSEPNFQNLPSEIRGRFIFGNYTGSITRVDDFNLRKAFVARPGYKIVSIDYKQMEMRMFGIVSEEDFMLEALRSGKDIHQEIAYAVWGTRDPVQREWAKNIAFGLIYGMTLGSLRFRLGMTLEQARKVAEDYWKTFPRMRPWLHAVQRECAEKGFIRYWSGRIWREENFEDAYKGANALVQGGCADFLSVVAIRAYKFLREANCGNILNLVHDEIVFELKEECLEDVIPKLVHIMEAEDLLGLPFLTSVKLGDNYGEIKPWKETEESKQFL